MKGTDHSEEETTFDNSETISGSTSRGNITNSSWFAFAISAGAAWLDDLFEVEETTKDQKARLARLQGKAQRRKQKRFKPVNRQERNYHNRRK